MHLLKSYLLLASRRLFRDLTFSIIVIGGLAICIASCVFVIFYVYDELSYDRHNQFADRIYRVTLKLNDPPNTSRIRYTDQKIGPYLKRKYSWLEEYVRFHDINEKIRIGNEFVREPHIFYTDPSVFKVFTLPLIKGDPKSVFRERYSCVLSESLAEKYFKGDPIDKTILIGITSYVVTGVMEDVPRNSDKWINGLVYGPVYREEDEAYIMFDTYVLVNNEIREAGFRDELKKSVMEIYNQAGEHLEFEYETQELKDIHFTSGIEMDNPKGKKSQVYIFLIISFILFLVTLVNVINLTTVKYIERTREVGLRKVIGANKGQLIKQFLIESFLSAAMAGIISLSLIQVFLPQFRSFSGKEIELTIGQDIRIVLAIILLLIIITIIASIYPAWIVSSFNPVKNLKGILTHGQRGISMQKVFISAQFMLTSALLTFLIIVTSQIKWMQDSDMGFNDKQVIVAEIPPDSPVLSKLDFIKNELKKCESIYEVSFGGIHSLPGSDEAYLPVWLNQSGSEKEHQVQSIVADPEYTGVMQMKILDGNPLSYYPESLRHNYVLINESMAKYAGWDDPVGMTFETFSYENWGRREVTVAGIIKDFHFKSLHNVISPMILFTQPNDNSYFNGYVYLQIDAGGFNAARIAWNEIFPNDPVEFTFLSDSFAQQYRTEKILLKLVTSFSLLIILLAGMGLFGLTAYSVESRTKEIGIRKVMGADIHSIIFKLSKEFVILVLSGAVLGSLITLYVSTLWLENFAYRININPEHFIVPIFLTILISLVITGIKTYRAALANPVEALRYE